MGSNLLILYSTKYSAQILHSVHCTVRKQSTAHSQFVFGGLAHQRPQQQGDQCETKREEPQAAQKKLNGTREHMTTGGDVVRVGGWEVVEGWYAMLLLSKKDN